MLARRFPQNRGSLSAMLSVYQQSLPSFGIQKAVASSEISPRFYTTQQDFRQKASEGNFSVAMAATASSLLLAVASSWNPPQTLCEASSDSANDQASNENRSSSDEDPEEDPYDNLPEEDEPTNCSICLTYRQGPCRPYWRKVEACTKDTEKENKENSTEAKGSTDNDDEDDESSPSTRCFKYMMPWIDCASQHRNLYTLIEMDTNYTEGIQDLEATSRHFCWMPGKEPKINWTNYAKDTSPVPPEETISESTASKDNVAMWKTLDPAMGDPKIITVDTTVPAMIDDGKGVLEVAYAVDQDSNVIGFAYGTKPSEVAEEGNTSEKEEIEDPPKKATEADDNKMIPMEIRIVATRTREVIIAASYTYRIEGAKNAAKGDGSKSEKDSSGAFLESHLYKSKPFLLAEVPKVENPVSNKEENE